MKGLIIKDLMCLRKQLVIFAYVVVGVLVVSVMFVLSARFGNIASGNQEMMAENGLSHMDINNMATQVLMLFMLLPVACVGDFAKIFEEDGKAGFVKVSSILPLSVRQRVLAKFITVFAMFSAGTVTDLVIAFILSRLTDIITFKEFLGIIISAVSLVSIFSALVIVLCFVFGYGKEDYARILALLIMIVTALLANISKIREIIMAVRLGDDTNVNFLTDFIEYFQCKSYMLFLIAALTVMVSYFISVFVAERKRGVV